MGGAASVRSGGNSQSISGQGSGQVKGRNGNESGGGGGSSSSSRTSPATIMFKNDLALREALRHLQLSPDMVDKSADAIHAHARDPVEHPVDKDLERLCASEFTSGALHALSWYLAAVLEGANGGRVPCNVGVDRSVGAGSSRPASAAAETAAARRGVGDQCPIAAAGPQGSGIIPPIQMEEVGRSGASLADTMTGRLGTFFNRMRRTRSMPSVDCDLVVPPASCEALVSPHSIRTSNSKRVSSDIPLPKMSVRVSPSPRGPSSQGKPTFLAGLGLGSPSSRNAASPRRAPVRTGHWKLGHEIGKGSFGAVHIGLNEDSGDLIAVKVLSLHNPDTAEPLYKEIELMQKLRHPNIVCYLGAEVNDSEKTISIFQEWVPGSVTTLLVNFGPFSDRRIAGYTKQILQGLVYLHGERVIHRDIKGGNILIDDRGVVKLCDFGASTMLDTESFAGLGDHTRVGSPLFMAPEILLRHDYGPQVDIWSLGGAVLEMATGQPPWHTLNLRTPVALVNWVKNSDGPPPLPEDLSPALTRFLLRCFERDPNKRATAQDLLADPFVTKRPGKVLKSPGSDGDSVSDIDNLSRTAAIARIRRASCSDCSGPDSAGSSPGSAVSRPASPSGSPHVGHGVGAVSPRGDVGGSPTKGVGHSSGEVFGAPSQDGRTGGGPANRPARPVSLQTGLQRASLEVVTAGLEPSSGPRITTPPPSRRLSAGRGNSASPNPFGGRRRSLENSPENSRGSRGSSLAHALAAARQASEHADRTDGASGVRANEGNADGPGDAELDRSPSISKAGGVDSTEALEQVRKAAQGAATISLARASAESATPPAAESTEREGDSERALLARKLKSGRGARPSRESVGGLAAQAFAPRADTQD